VYKRQDYDYNARKNVARYLAGLDEELDQTKDLQMEPTFGCNLIRKEELPNQ